MRVGLCLLVLAVVGSRAARAVNTGSDELCRGQDCPSFRVLKAWGGGVELRRYDSATFAVTDVDADSYEKATAVGFQRLLGYLLGNNELGAKIEMTTPVTTTFRLDKDGRVTDDFSVAVFLPYKYQRCGPRLSDPAVPDAPADEDDDPCDDDDEDDSGTPSSSGADDDAGGSTGGEEGEDDVERRKRRHRRRREEPATVPLPKDERVKIITLKSVDVYVNPFGGYALGVTARRLAMDFMDFLERNGEKDFDGGSFAVAVYDPPFRPFDRHNEIFVYKQSGKHVVRQGAGEQQPDAS